jgi:hypothetical protein
MIETIVSTALICYVLSDMANFISEMIYGIAEGVKTRLKVFILILVYIMSCQKCFSFWFSLILTANLFISAAVALIVWIVDEIIKQKLKTKL